MGGRALQDCTLGPDAVRDHQVGVVAGQRALPILRPSGALYGLDEPPDQQARHVFQCGQIDARTIVGLRDPARCEHPSQRLGELALVQVGGVQLTGHRDDRGHLDR